MKFVFLYQCFPTFFGSRHPYLVLKVFGGTLGWFIRYKYQGIVTTGSTLGTSSRHPSVSRHPGWESLFYIIEKRNDNLNKNHNPIFTSCLYERSGMKYPTSIIIDVKNIFLPLFQQTSGNRSIFSHKPSGHDWIRNKVENARGLKKFENVKKLFWALMLIRVSGWDSLFK